MQQSFLSVLSHVFFLLWHQRFCFLLSTVVWRRCSGPKLFGLCCCLHLAMVLCLWCWFPHAHIWMDGWYKQQLGVVYSYICCPVAVAFIWSCVSDPYLTSCFPAWGHHCALCVKCRTNNIKTEHVSCKLLNICIQPRKLNISKNLCLLNFIFCPCKLFSSSSSCYY